MGRKEENPTLDSVMKEVKDAAQRWRENARYAAKAGHYIESQQDLERAIMLEWVLEISAPTKVVADDDDGIHGEVPKGRPKCFSCCAENPEWLLKKFGITEKQCDECKHHKACFKAY